MAKFSAPLHIEMWISAVNYKMNVATSFQFTFFYFSRVTWTRISIFLLLLLLFELTTYRKWASSTLICGTQLFLIVQNSLGVNKHGGSPYTLLNPFFCMLKFQQKEVISVKVLHKPVSRIISEQIKR